MMRLSCEIAIVVMLVGCFEEAPRVSNPQCAPQTLSAAPPGPYAIECDADISGPVTDSYWTAVDASAIRWADDLYPTIETRKVRARLASAQSPAIGTITIKVEADGSDDDPPGNSLEIQLEVVP